MKRLLNIIIFLGLSVSIFSQYATEYKAELIEATEEIIITDTTLLDYIQEHAPSGTARDAGSGTSLDGNSLDWDGTLDKDVQILGAGNSVEIGTDVSKVNGFRVISSNEIDFESPMPMKFSAGLLWTLDEEYWYNDNYDTLGTKADIRELILASESVLPFNFDYTFNSSVVDSRPGIGYFKFNYQTLSSVTEIYIDYFDQNTISQNVFLSAADSGSYIAIQSSTNNYVLYQLNDGYVDNGNYYTYKVDYIGHNGVISGSSVLDLNISNNTGGGSAATGSDSTLISSTDTITLSNGILDGSGIDAEFDEVDATSFRGDYFYVRDSYDDDSTTVYRHPSTGLTVSDNTGIILKQNTATITVSSNNVQINSVNAQINSDDIQIISGDDVHISSTDRIELEADTRLDLASGIYKTVIVNDTIYSDGTNGSTENNIKIKDGFFSNLWGAIGSIFEADTVKAYNINSTTQTLAGTTLTGVSNSKDAIEGTQIDSLSTINDSLLIKGKITSDYYIGQLYTDDGSVTVTTTPVDTYFTILGMTSDINVNTTLTDSTITIATTGAGYYTIYGGFSYTHETTSTICHASLFINDIEITVNEAERKIGNGGDYGDAGRSSIVWLNGGDVIKYKMKADSQGTLTIINGNINVSRIN